MQSQFKLYINLSVYFTVSRLWGQISDQTIVIIEFLSFEEKLFAAFSACTYSD